MRSDGLRCSSTHKGCRGRPCRGFTRVDLEITHNCGFKLKTCVVKWYAHYCKLYLRQCFPSIITCSFILFNFFSAQNLPRDDGEFYQFVYFNDRNKMCGASTPFQFKTPRNDDLIEQELEDEDFLHITTNTLILEEKIRKIELEKEMLNQVE